MKRKMGRGIKLDEEEELVDRKEEVEDVEEERDEMENGKRNITRW